MNCHIAFLIFLSIFLANTPRMTAVEPPTVQELVPQNFPVLKNDRIIKAANGLDVDKIPIWIMRQAGRFLPEFREFRQQHDFFTICRTPELACEVTLFPIRRFDLDAAIIFSDILVIPQALGIDVEMRPGVGPVFLEPLNEPSELSRLNVTGAVDRLKYVGQAITVTRHRLNGKVPLIGFSGGPWTLMSYMIDGSSKTYANAKKWLYKYPDASGQLLDILTDTIVDYLVMQIESGAQLVQVFESNMEYLNLEMFRQWAKPRLALIARKIREKLVASGREPVPIILFCKGGHFALGDQSEMGYDVLGVDWTITPEVARQATNNSVTLQGNLDPVSLQSSNREEFVARVRTMASAFGKRRYIANLGHGIYPDAPIENVELFINTIHGV